MGSMSHTVEALALSPDRVLVDENRVPRSVDRARWAPVVKGDQRVAAIAAASILAKVDRDRMMVELDAVHPGDGVASNKGYPSVDHRAALVKLGPSAVHRRSFLVDYSDDRTFGARRSPAR